MTAGIKFKLVEVVVFRLKEAPEFLLLKRSDNEEIYPGLWQIISGGVKRGEKAYETAVREIREEIGTKPKRLFNTPLTNTFYTWTDNSVNLSPVFAAEVGADAEVKLSDEHRDYRWLSKDKAISLLVWPGQKEAIRIVQNFILDKNTSTSFLKIKIR